MEKRKQKYLYQLSRGATDVYNRNSKEYFAIRLHQLTDLLTNPCGIPWGCTAEIAETVGGGPADGGGTDDGGPALCGASCGVVL